MSRARDLLEKWPTGRPLLDAERRATFPMHRRMGKIKLETKMGSVHADSPISVQVRVTIAAEEPTKKSASRTALIGERQVSGETLHQPYSTWSAGVTWTCPLFTARGRSGGADRSGELGATEPVRFAVASPPCSRAPRVHR